MLSIESSNLHHSDSNATARFNMIEQQVRPWEVLDPTVLKLLAEVPREKFVPKGYEGLAFADVEIPLGKGQMMLSPKLEGRLLQTLDVQKTHKVLHIGTGSGFFAVLLGHLAQSVLTLEIFEELVETAQQHIHAIGLQNVVCAQADGANGCPKGELYDRIVYTASSPVEPKQVRQQLNVGGKLLIVLGTVPAMRATLISRVAENAYKEAVIFETCLPALMNAPAADTFEF